jgi:hypothetical protein
MSGVASGVNAIRNVAGAAAAGRWARAHGKTQESKEIAPPAPVDRQSAVERAPDARQPETIQAAVTQPRPEPTQTQAVDVDTAALDDDYEDAWQPPARREFADGMRCSHCNKPLQRRNAYQTASGEWVGYDCYNRHYAGQRQQRSVVTAAAPAPALPTPAVPQAVQHYADSYAQSAGRMSEYHAEAGRAMDAYRVQASSAPHASGGGATNIINVQGDLINHGTIIQKG